MALTLAQQRYRPESGMRQPRPWARITVCFSKEQMAAIHEVAKRKDCSVAFAIRQLVDVGLAVEDEP